MNHHHFEYEIWYEYIIQVPTHFVLNFCAQIKNMAKERSYEVVSNH